MSEEKKKRMDQIKKEHKEELYNKIYWQNKISQFENSKANKVLKYLLLEGNRTNGIKPWFAEVIQIVLLCVRTAYANAYGLDNLTSKMYYKLTEQLTTLSDIKNPDEFIKQEEKLKKFLNHLPGEFPEYEAWGGLVKTASGEDLSIKEFEVIWKFVESDTFDIFSVDNLMESMKDYQEKSK